MPSSIEDVEWKNSTPLSSISTPADPFTLDKHDPPTRSHTSRTSNDESESPRQSEKQAASSVRRANEGHDRDVEEQTSGVGELVPGMPLEQGEEGRDVLPVEEEDVIPEGGYGWVIVACMAAMNASTWGMNTTYGVFTAYYMQHNYFEGGSDFRYAWVGGLSVATALGSGPFINLLCRVFGTKVPMVLGMVCVTLGQTLAGICTSFFPFMVCQGIVFGFGLGCLLITTSPLLAHYFKRRLSFAQGFANGGSGLGGLIFSNTTRVSLERLGVKWALVINGMISCFVLIPVCILMKGRHKAVKAKSLSLEVKWFVHPGFVWILLWASCSMIAYFVALYSLASFATHGLGLTQTQGASLQSILAASQMIGRPSWGFLLDRGGRINMCFICYVLCGLSSLAIWLPAKSYGVLILFAIVQGATSGTVWNAAAPLTAQMIGVQDLASALSVFWLTLLIPALVGQPLAILLLNYSTNQLGRTGAAAYYNSIGFCGAMGMGASLFLIGAKRYSQGNWKVLTKK